MQSAKDIITFLDSGWNSANTDKVAPEVVNALETPWQSLDFGVSDILYVKNELELVKTGMYALNFYHDVLCIIEVMTAKQGEVNGTARLTHFQNLVDETMRLVKANARLSGYVHTSVTAGRPRYVKDRGIYLCAVEVKMLRHKTS